MANIQPTIFSLNNIDLKFPVNLQFFATRGVDEIILLRVAGQVVDATKILNLKEQTRSFERESDSEATVDGPINTGGSLEAGVEFSAFVNPRDPLVEEIEDAIQDGGVAYEMWIINRTWKHDTEDKWRAEYRQGYFTKFERSAEADGLAEYEVEFVQYAKMVRGFATLPQAIADNRLAYGFVDTLSTTPATEGLAVIPQPTATVAPTV